MVSVQVATLTIEETFSEDTARYTVKVNNGVGEAESSAYLHVKGMHGRLGINILTEHLKWCHRV